jgi:ABC-type glycerol-3-phosphate transport system substrate-binding protein
MLCALIMVAAMGGLVGCGGLVMGKSVPTSHVTNPGTTAGTYTFTVTGTGNDSAQTTATTTFTLTVN